MKTGQRCELKIFFFCLFLHNLADELRCIIRSLLLMHACMQPVRLFRYGIFACPEWGENRLHFSRGWLKFSSNRRCSYMTRQAFKIQINPLRAAARTPGSMPLTKNKKNPRTEWRYQCRCSQQNHSIMLSFFQYCK